MHRQDAWFHTLKGRGPYRKRNMKRLDATFHHGGSAAAEDIRERSPTPQNATDLLSNSVILKVYKKATHKKQDVDLQRVLELLQEMESCQEVPQNKMRLGCVLKLLEIWDQPGAIGSSDCLSKQLKIRLKDEVAQGEISDFSWHEMRIALRSFIAPSFEQFWDEMSEGLKKHGVAVQPSQIAEEHWCKLEPFLHSMAAKVVLKRLRSQKANVGSAATVQPTKEDKSCFWQSLRNAAEGWLTTEMLHFLKHLQVHGPPVLESCLRFLLEVQKFKNAHHDWPDTVLLKKKVLVIRDCFLASQLEPRLQVLQE